MVTQKAGEKEGKGGRERGREEEAEERGVKWFISAGFQMGLKFENKGSQR